MFRLTINHFYVWCFGGTPWEADINPLCQLNTCTGQSTCLPGPSWKGWSPIQGWETQSLGCADELVHSRVSSFQAGNGIYFTLYLSFHLKLYHHLYLYFHLNLKIFLYFYFHLYLYFCENLAAQMLFHRTTPLWVLLPPTAGPTVLAARVLQQLVLPKRALGFSTTGKLCAGESWSSLFLVIGNNYKKITKQNHITIKMWKNLMIRRFPSSVKPRTSFAMSAQCLPMSQPGGFCVVGLNNWWAMLGRFNHQCPPGGYSLTCHDYGMLYYEDLEVVWHL